MVYFYGKEYFLPLITGSLFLFFLINMVAGRDMKDAAMDIAFKAFGIIYVALPLSYLPLVREVKGGEWWILFLLVVIWANDTCAYFVGRSAGRHRLASVISPKKSVEGAAGGIIGGMAAAFLLNRFFSLGMSPAAVAAISIVFGIAGIVGDLSESLLKRGAGVKDSGTLIPGHGGVLDRIDSLLFPVPLLYYFLIW